MFVCDAGDIVVVPFPFTDVAAAKPRPALALSPQAANEACGNTVFAMITTASATRWPNDVSLTDLESAGLRTPSVVRIKLFTLDNRLVSRKIGTLGPRDRRAVRQMLRAAITI